MKNKIIINISGTQSLKKKKNCLLPKTKLYIIFYKFTNRMKNDIDFSQ